MGAIFTVPTPPDPWSVFESPDARTPYYRTPEPRNMLPPTPWIFRGGPNRSFLVLLAMLAAGIGVAAILARLL